MGLDYNGIKFLLFTKKYGINIKKLATFGRQEIHLTTDFLNKYFPTFFNFEGDLGGLSAGKLYSESLFKQLGSEEITSFDYSSYENCTVIHDFNVEIPIEYHNKFSVVFDSGTMEHVFNVPVAMSNLMRMTEVGGHLIQIVPGNNFFGHGLYQFSPEFYYAFLHSKNGFKILDMFVFEDLDDSFLYNVVKEDGFEDSRLNLITKFPLYIAVIAEKIGDCDSAYTCDMQTDYKITWSSKNTTNVKRKSKNYYFVRLVLFRFLFVRNILKIVKYRKFALGRSKYFQKKAFNW